MFERRAGQVVLFDLIMSFVLFLMLFGAASYLWNASLSGLQETTSRYHLQERAIQANELLVRSPGIPERWEADLSRMRVLGLATRDRVLSPQKVGNITNIEYAVLKNGLRLRDFECYMRVIQPGTGVLAETGLRPQGSDYATSARRIAWYEGRAVIVEVTIWK